MEWAIVYPAEFQLIFSAASYFSCYFLEIFHKPDHQTSQETVLSVDLARACFTDYTVWPLNKGELFVYSFVFIAQTHRIFLKSWQSPLCFLVPDPFVLCVIPPGGCDFLLHLGLQIFPQLYFGCYQTLWWYLKSSTVLATLTKDLVE